jgi:hypothetical protein
MRKIGRKSAEDRGAALLPGAPPPDPPDDLAEPERALWRKITASLPADWFGAANHPLLKNYVRHVHSADLLSRDIAERRAEIEQARQAEAQATEPKDIARARTVRLQLEKSVRSLLASYNYQSDRVMRLATKMRLSQMSRYKRADAAFAAPKDTPKPWEDWRGFKRQ